MRCIIRIVDGVPFEHPILVDNFTQAFPDIDLNAPLPEGFAWFDRKLRPQIQAHEVFVDENAHYEWDGAVWTDVWRVRDKTEEEIRAEAATSYEMNRQYVVGKIASLEDDAEGVAAWTAYLGVMDAHAAANPLNPQMPPHPYKAENGMWISVTNSGSAPNVIG